MSTQNYSYPSSSDVTLTGTPNGAPIPSTSILVAGENPSGLQEPLQTNAAGDLIVVPAAGSTTDVNLTQVSGVAITEGQKTMAASLPVVIASDQSTLPISAASLPLPTGAATSANQATEITSLSTIATNTTNLVMTETAPGTAAPFALTVQGNAAGIPVPVSLAASTGTSNVNISQYGGTTTTLGIKASAASIPVVIASDQVVPISATALPLPTGASTSANQVTAQTSLSTMITNQGTIITDLGTIITNQTSGSATVGIAGTVIANTPIINVYTTTPITTATYVQLVASTTNTINNLHLFDSSGQAMILGIGASGSEVTTLFVPPGGDTYTLRIPAGSRLAYKALTANAVAGYLLMSFLE
jgi:hypothetical protein